MKESVRSVKEAVVDLDIDNIQGLVTKALDGGADPWEIIKEGMGEGMSVVGRRFEEGEYFLADLILAGEVMKEGMAVLEPRIDKSQAGKKGTVVLATVKGDIHDIGKNIVGIMLAASDFKVVDLGVDVPEDKIVAAVKEAKAPALGLSILLTTMIGGIKDTVDALAEAGLRDKVKIVIGGACTSEKLAKEMGVDGYGEDAVKAVSIFEKAIRA
jgi:corrinoid protein of di/trimethylamine methyltransferase